MFNTMPTVSIILPIYNVEPYLRECIDSCIEQVDAPDYEIILVDDGSTDNCGAICDEYASLHDNIKVVHQPNSGLAAARNAGLAVAGGQWILFVDSDDFIDKSLLSRCFKAIRHYGDVDMVQFAYCHVDDAGQPLDVVKGVRYNRLYNSVEEYGSERGYRWEAWSFLARRDIIELHDLYFDKELRFAEDVHYTMRYLYYCDKIATIALTLYYYRQRVGSMMFNRNVYRQVKFNLTAAGLLMKFFYEKSGGNCYPRFFKKCTTRLVLNFIKALDTLDDSDLQKASADYAEFRKCIKRYPGTLTGKLKIMLANLNFNLYVKMRRR